MLVIRNSTGDLEWLFCIVVILSIETGSLSLSSWMTAVVASPPNWWDTCYNTFNFLKVVSRNKWLKTRYWQLNLLKTEYFWKKKNHRIFTRLYKHGIQCKNKLMSYQISTDFRAKEMSQILVLFILCESNACIILVWNYYIGGTTQPLVLLGAFCLFLTTQWHFSFFLQYFCNISYLSYEKYNQDQIIQDTLSQNCRGCVK